MGEPITLTIKIGGNKYLKPINWPVLEDVEEGGSIEYYRDDEQVHHVPKRRLDEIIVS